MRMTTLAAAALMCSASAFAQTGTAPTSDAAATAPNATTTEPPAASPEATPPAAPSAAGSMSDSSTSAGSVDIAAYDSNKDGALSPLEFGMAMKGSDPSLSAEAKRERFSRASGNGAIRLLNETAADFTKADKNQDKRVDPSELAMLQSGSTSAGGSAPITSGAGNMGSAPPETGATMSTSPSGSPDTGVTSDSPPAAEVDETDPSDPNTTATVPPTEPKR